MKSIRRIPIRIRVTLAFSVAMALLLGGLGLFLYLRLEEQITETLDAGLETRADELQSRTSASGIPDLAEASAGLSEDDESFAQLLSADGAVVDSTAQLGGTAAVVVVVDSVVVVELVDGALLRLSSLSPEPGYGFITLVPHAEDDDPQEVIVPLGAIRQLTLRRATDESPVGFSLPGE